MSACAAGRLGRARPTLSALMTRASTRETLVALRANPAQLEPIDGRQLSKQRLTLERQP